MKIQLNATSLKRVQDLTNQIANIDTEIRTCLFAREFRANWEAADPQTRIAELPIRKAEIAVWHHAGMSSYRPENQGERDALFDLTEILIRRRRDRLIAQIDAMGVALTDLDDFGPAPAWPTL